MNLLKETQEMLVKVGKVAADVQWVQFGGMTSFYCSWPEYVAASNFDYDDGFGGAEVAPSLKIVGVNWWLERGEYDGSEWWEFKTRPTKPKKARTPEMDDLKEN